ISSNATAHYREASEQQMQRCAYRLLKALLIRNLFAKLCKRAERVDEPVPLIRHPLDVRNFEILNSHASTTCLVTPSMSNSSTVSSLTSENTTLAPRLDAESIIPSRIETPTLFTSSVCEKLRTSSSQPSWSLVLHSRSIFSPESLFR